MKKIIIDKCFNILDKIIIIISIVTMFCLNLLESSATKTILIFLYWGLFLIVLFILIFKKWFWTFDKTDEVYTIFLNNASYFDIYKLFILPICIYPWNLFIIYYIIKNTPSDIDDMIYFIIGEKLYNYKQNISLKSIENKSNNI